ncbi:hypothetical protein F5878DRAFT_329136 [Lentinula raphanica]|uniref:Secreted protein n=1 Tax=Lentinula raphanica TaxID=153919 RepID=A0AA38P2F4_9AGAR|nr:hypothetical protein F5878DRAFT_329136 [Lentinula raphanica]
MRLNTSIFHTVLCLGAILHAACGSPMPPSTQTGDDAPPSYDTPGGAPALLITSSAKRFLPYDEVVRRSSHSDTAESCPWEFDTLERNPEFAALIDNHIEVGLTMFGSRELGSFIPGFHTHPDRHHIRFDYPGPRPLPIVNNRVTPSMQTLWCYVDFGPDQTSGTRPFRGVGLLQVYLMDGKPNFGSSSMRLELEGNSEVQMRIGPFLLLFLLLRMRTFPQFLLRTGFSTLSIPIPMITWGRDSWLSGNHPQEGRKD